MIHTILTSIFPIVGILSLGVFFIILPQKELFLNKKKQRKKLFIGARIETYSGKKGTITEISATTVIIQDDSGQKSEHLISLVNDYA